MKRKIFLAGENAAYAADGEMRVAYRLPKRNRGVLLSSLRARNEAEQKGCKGRLLVMDDQEIVRGILCVMLLALGYETHQVSDGAEAVEIYTRAKDSGNPFDAVIIDLNIPGGMGGKQAMERLLAIDPGVKAIVLSGDLNDPAMEHFARYGFVGVLRKPYAIGELRRLMQDTISQENVSLCDMPSGPAGNCG
jgi:CheY-like chemotaxis protein